MIDYAEIYKDGKLFGYIGQSTNGKIYVRGNKSNSRILMTFVSPIKIDIAVIEGDVSVSNSEIMFVEDPNWITYMEYNLPAEYNSSNLMQTTLAKFKGLKL